jgi:hypothetical protein
MAGADQAVHVVDAQHQVGAQVADQDLEFLDPIFHRRAGEEQDAVRRARPLPDGLGALGGHVLGVVGLVDHQHAEVDPWGPGQRLQGVVGGHGDTAGACPRAEVLLAVRAVQQQARTRHVRYTTYVRAILERAARGGSPPEWAEITERLDRIERALSAGLPHDDQKTA